MRMPPFAIYGHVVIGIIHSKLVNQTKPIIDNARDLVRLPKYSSGDVIDQYRSNESVSKFSIDAVLAV
jgi:hypothetical protein